MQNKSMSFDILFCIPMIAKTKSSMSGKSKRINNQSRVVCRLDYIVFRGQRRIETALDECPDARRKTILLWYYFSSRLLFSFSIDILSPVCVVYGGIEIAFK